MIRRALAAVVALAALGATSCSDGTTDGAGAEATSPGDGPVTGATTATTTATPSDGRPTERPAGRDGRRYSQWELYARPLPLRPDGFGVIRPTPEELRVRRFPTKDLLPPPEDGRFVSSIGPVTPAIRKRMGATWSPRCPVRLDELRYLNVSFRGFDDRAHTGELVVAATEAREVVSVFRALFRADFPIEEMRLPTTADLEAHPTGDGNNTAGLVCRAARGQTSWSAHAYGLAVDINPFMNPFVKDDLVLPELASAYTDRTRKDPGMIHADSVAVREFRRIGWSWGGAWRSLKDYQHFSATGR